MRIGFFFALHLCVCLVPTKVRSRCWISCNQRYPWLLAIVFQGMLPSLCYHCPYRLCLICYCHSAILCLKQERKDVQGHFLELIHLKGEVSARHPSLLFMDILDVWQIYNVSSVPNGHHKRHDTIGFAGESLGGPAVSSHSVPVRT